LNAPLASRLLVERLMSARVMPSPVAEGVDSLRSLDRRLRELVVRVLPVWNCLFRRVRTIFRFTEEGSRACVGSR
jgi:hypothetical protein